MASSLCQNEDVLIIEILLLLLFLCVYAYIYKYMYTHIIRPKIFVMSDTAKNDAILPPQQRKGRLLSHRPISSSGCSIWIMKINLGQKWMGLGLSSVWVIVVNISN